MKKDNENEEDKEKAIEEAISQLQKKYGKSAVLQMNDDVSFEVEAVSTGCFSLDDVFDCGGLPRGRIIELFGEESSGKSSLAIFLMAEIQRNGGKAALIDAEHAFDKEYSRRIGLDVTKLIVSQPDTLEEAIDVVSKLVSSQGIDIIVVDSVAAMVPKAELEGDEILKDTMALQARLMGKALRILTGAVSKSNTIVIFINQLREKIGIFYGKKEITPGGKALKFYASVRLEVRKGTKIEGKDKEQIGNALHITAVKNKVGYPWKSTDIDLYYGTGIDLTGDTFDYGEKIEVLTKTGNTYTYGNFRLGVGREQVKTFLKNNNEIYEKIRKEIKERINTKVKSKE